MPRIIAIVKAIKRIRDLALLSRNLPIVRAESSMTISSLKTYMVNQSALTTREKTLLKLALEVFFLFSLLFWLCSTESLSSNTCSTSRSGHWYSKLWSAQLMNWLRGENSAMQIILMFPSRFSSRKPKKGKPLLEERIVFLVGNLLVKKQEMMIEDVTWLWPKSN